MLFYDTVQHVLRPMAKMVYHHYSKNDITTLLKLTSLQWLTVGIVSGNDYDPNIWGYGIARNCKIIRSIPGTTVAGIVKEYLEAIESKSSAPFDTAQKVFVTHKQELADTQVEVQAATLAVAQFQIQHNTKASA